MEFERAIFRVYERCVDGLRDDDNIEQPGAMSSKSCRTIEFVALSFSAFFLFILIFLHVTFVGNPGCLPNHLMNTPMYNATTKQFTMENDFVLQIDVDRKFSPLLENARRQREAENDDDYVPSNNKRTLRGGETSNFNQISNHRKLSASSSSTTLQWVHASVFQETAANSTKEDSIVDKNSNITTKSTTAKSSSSYHDFEITNLLGLLVLPSDLRDKHNFVTVNVTLQGSECFGNSLTQTFLPFGGIDTVVKNFVVSTFKQSGAMSTAAGDYYSWSSMDLSMLFGGGTIVEYIIIRIEVLLMSLMSFYMLSTITALLVRVLISSGVVLLFPIFYLLQLMGLQVLHHRIISLSYPWIGIPMEMMRARNQSTFPFMLGHFTRVFVYYVLYEAIQIAFSFWFYNDMRPGQKELWLFAIMMLWEYFSMIYVRSRGSIYLFPRVSLALYLIYHFYVYLQPFGFHLLALLVMFTSLIALMVYCIRKFEVEAFHRGHVNIDQPRAFYNTIPWPVWSVALAPDFTVFMPITEESHSIYNMPIDDVNLHGQANAMQTNTTVPSETRRVNTDNSTTTVIHINSGDHHNSNNDLVSRSRSLGSTGGSGSGHNRGIRVELTTANDEEDSDESQSFLRRNATTTMTTTVATASTSNTTLSSTSNSTKKHGSVSTSMELGFRPVATV